MKSRADIGSCQRNWIIATRFIEEVRATAHCGLGRRARKRLCKYRDMVKTLMEMGPVRETLQLQISRTRIVICTKLLIICIGTTICTNNKRENRKFTCGEQTTSPALMQINKTDTRINKKNLLTIFEVIICVSILLVISSIMIKFSSPQINFSFPRIKI